MSEDVLMIIPTVRSAPDHETLRAASPSPAEGKAYQPRSHGRIRPILAPVPAGGELVWGCWTILQIIG
jgi:hypothetical protein